MERKFSTAWFDPTKLSEKEVAFDYLKNYYYARACQDVLDYITYAVAESEALLKKQKGEVEPNKFREAF